MSKRNILWVSEASFLRTGFSTQGRSILQYLYDTGKYNIIELGSYAETNDPRAMELPWKFYGANSYIDNIEKAKAQSYQGQFGFAVFDRILLEEKIDTVIDIRDPFFIEWQLESPFRKNFNLIWQPTVDSEPQQRIWIDNFARADLILTLSRYGKEVLEREAKGLVKIFDIARPGADHNYLFPKNRDECREKIGIPKDANLLLTVMRNQPRKLFPDLLEVFKDLLNKFAENGKKDLCEKTYLYLHTSYPDVGFDIPRFIIQNGLSSKVLFTYTCRNCGCSWADFWQTELTFCPKCKNMSGFLPNTGVGVTSEFMCDLYNSANLYIQYSVCEGLGMGIAEAKACGIPCIAPDYSAMSEQVEIPGCIKVKIKKIYHESLKETQQDRSYPDNEDCVKKLYNWFTQPKDKWDQFKDILRKDILEGYSFERSAKIFEKAIDSLPEKDINKTWLNHNPVFYPDRFQMPQIASTGSFVDWYLDKILKEPNLKTTEWRNQLVKSINVGYHVASQGREQFNREMFHNFILSKCRERNHWERRRMNKFYPEKDEFVNWETI